jgi:hypothetical protein
MELTEETLSLLHQGSRSVEALRGGILFSRRSQKGLDEARQDESPSYDLRKDGLHPTYLEGIERG